MKNHQRILWITRTGVLVALLIALQWVTAPTSAFAGQYITGSCVNAVLAVATLTAGLWCGVVVGALSPFCAFLLGIGPKLIQIIPAIALGNLAFVMVLFLAIGRARCPLWRQALGILGAAGLKFLVLYIAVVQVILPLLALPASQAAAFTAMFSYPQLITALIGGVLALLLVPMVRKARGRE